MIFNDKQCYFLKKQPVWQVTNKRKVEDIEMPNCLRNTDCNYRPGQPNWEYPMWKFQNFSATQILREINFGHFEAQ